MSTRLSFREVLVRQAHSKAKSPEKSDSPSFSFSLQRKSIKQPIKVVRLLMRHGHSLRKAHDVIDRLALGEEVVTELSAASPAKALAELADVGVAAALISVPDVDLQEVRQRLRISQAEFAARFGFALDSIRNWEQGRYRPDDAARTLLSIIGRHPQVVDEALRKPGAEVLNNIRQMNLGGFVLVTVKVEPNLMLSVQPATPLSSVSPFVVVPVAKVGRQMAGPAASATLQQMA